VWTVTENASALFPPPAIQGFILESAELVQMFSQPVQAAFTKRTCLPSVKQIANSKGVGATARCLDPSQHGPPQLHSYITSENPLCLRKHPLIGSHIDDPKTIEPTDQFPVWQLGIEPRRLPYVGIHITECDHRRRRAGGAREKQRKLVDEVTCGCSPPAAPSVDLAEGSCDSGQVCRRNGRVSRLPSL
jgi:hypothetical protein